MGEKPVPMMLDRLADASPSALITYLDLLCNFPGDERIYEYTVREFLHRPGQRAMFAALLGKLGDRERALTAYAKCMSLKPAEAEPYRAVAELYRQLGDEERVRNALKTGYDRTGDLELFRAYEAMGEPQSAN